MSSDTTEQNELAIEKLRSLASAHDPSTEVIGIDMLRQMIQAADMVSVIRIYIILGRFYINALGNSAKALEYARLAEQIAEEHKISPAIKADMSMMLSGIYKFTAQYHRAIQYLNDSLEHLQQIKEPDKEDKRLLQEACLNCAVLYFNLGMKHLATDYIERALAVAGELGDRGGVVKAKITLAKHYFNTKQYQKALDIYMEVLPEDDLLVSDENKAVLRDYIGMTYQAMERLTEAEDYLSQSLALRMKGLQKIKRIHPMHALARLYYQQGKQGQGDVLLKEILELVEEHKDHFTERVLNALKYQLYEAKGDYKTAYQYWSKIELSSVDTEGIERTIQSMMEAERIKQEHMRQEAAMLKTLNEEMQQYARQLEYTNTDLKTYAHTTSHDLREPLRMISTYMTILSAKLNDKLDEDEKKFMFFAVDGAKRMDDMITRILNAAKSQDLSLKPVDLNRVAAQAQVNLTKLLQDKNAVFTHDPLPMVMGDEIQLLQVIQNLVTNAVKYNQSEVPAVHISFLRSDRLCTLSIADNGVGIAPADRENVFKMYQRVENATGEDGTGIGLSTVRRNIERMKGKIWIEGNEPRGSIFKIEIPLA